MNQTIFISIASYRDAELIPTLTNILDTASAPERLTIAVCWQVEERDFSPFTDIGAVMVTESADNPDIVEFNYRGARLVIHYIQIFKAQGACYARYCCEQLYHGEDYFLQIDSHCRFIENWDAEIISYYQTVEQDMEKPVITGYPPGYTPATEEKEEVRNEGPCRMTFNAFNDNDIPSFIPVGISGSVLYERGCFLAGGFLFACGSFVQDVPNDPLIFFIGEEISMSAKAFTHGYNVVYPNKIFVWHYYGRDECVRIWGDHSQENLEQKRVDKGWWELDAVSKDRVRVVLGIKKPPEDDEEDSDFIDLGKFCLGTARPLEEFEYLTGICFEHQLIARELLSNNRPSFFDIRPGSREEWITQLYSQYFRSIDINKSELPALHEEVDYWSLGVFAKDEQLLAMERITPDAMNALIVGDKPDIYRLDIKLKEKPMTVPDKIRIAPFFVHSGWGDTLEKAW